MTDRVEFFEVFPNKKFNFTKNSNSDYINAYLFKGSENMLNHKYDWTCDYICEFDYYWYPFDTQNCPIIMNADHKNLEINVENVTYEGKYDLGKYFFKTINHCNEDVDGRTGVFIDFTFRVNLLYLKSHMISYLLTRDLF